jgi:hypothetical protein
VSIEITECKVMESLVLDVISAKTYRRGITFLNCDSVRISGVSASRLKELY